MFASTPRTRASARWRFSTSNNKTWNSFKETEEENAAQALKKARTTFEALSPEHQHGLMQYYGEDLNFYLEIALSLRLAQRFLPGPARIETPSQPLSGSPDVGY
jgi:hypothetical protein